jgi:pimeloyl-ACP methyl ester carboxylesterase
MTRHFNAHDRSPGAPPASARRMGIALHCSGGNGRQWRRLAEGLGPDVHLVAPDLIGTPRAGPWSGSRPFTLAEEAGPILEMIDRQSGPVHLFGHSYGGGLALHVAAMRAERIASLSVYEPSAFGLLRGMGEAGAAALAEIEAIAGRIRGALADGHYEAGAGAFVDYWNGEGMWAALKPEIRLAMVQYLPKAALDFHALIGEQTGIGDYAGFSFPVTILRGEFAPRPTRLIAEYLGSGIATAHSRVIEGAGHMGPITHPEMVVSAFADGLGIPSAPGRSAGFGLMRTVGAQAF